MMTLYLEQLTIGLICARESVQDRLHCVFVMILNQTLIRKQYRTVNAVGQSAMTPTDHHQADDDLAEDVELSAQGSIHGGIA